jgi:hypothetical protein
MYVEEHASDLAELSVCGHCASDVAELPVPVIWQNCLFVVDCVPVIWQNCLHVEECASALAELPVPVMAELSVCGQCASDLAELPAYGGACQ